jgi:hypothetical protein
MRATGEVTDEVTGQVERLLPDLDCKMSRKEPQQALKLMQTENF